MINAAQENEQTLSKVLGIDEDEAREKLNTRIIVSHTKPYERFANEIIAQLDRTIHVTNDHTTCDLELVVASNKPTQTRAPALYISVTPHGFTISEQPIESSEIVHSLKEMIAACYAAGAALNLALQLNFGPLPVRAEFKDFGIIDSALESQYNFDQAYLAGAGAVGNGFLRALRHIKTGGELNIIDPKVVAAGNLNRCLYFSEKDIGEPKAATLATNAQGNFDKLRFVPIEGVVGDITKGGKKINRIFVAVDSRRTRRAIQSEIPLEVLDVSTTDVAEIIVHSHKQPTSNACLGCIYRHVPEEQAREIEIARGLGIDLSDLESGFINDEIAQKIIKKNPQISGLNIVGMSFDSLFRKLCAEMKLLTTGGKQIFAPFAFVSNLAGALLVVELMRLETKTSEEFNYFYLSPWRAPNLQTRRKKNRSPDCDFCSKQHNLDFMKELWTDSGRF